MSAVPIDHLTALILLDVFRLSEGDPPFIDAVSYRADHEDWLEKLDALESQQLLKRDNDRYRVSFVVLTLLEDDAILAELDRCERLFNLLRQHYKDPASRNEVKSLKGLAGDLGLSYTQMVRTVQYFMDASPLWCGGSSNSFSDPDAAFVKPSEGIIACKSFEDLVERVQAWFRPQSLQMGQVHASLLGDDAGWQLESQQAFPRRRAYDVCDVPEQTIKTYSRLWQFETWLRLMVYVELRAFAGDQWRATSKIGRAAERSQEAAKALIHMDTPEEDLLSYAQLSELRRIITENRRLFDPFLPPEKIWDARMDEVAQVRHRVAHFRKGNERDLDRVTHLLRDLDKGFWTFCTSYNDKHPVLPPTSDPVIAHFQSLDLLPWVEVEKGEWARIGSIPDDCWFGVSIETTAQPWSDWAIPVAGRAGILYDVTIFLRGSRPRHFDYTRLLGNTRTLHKHLVHICLVADATELRITIPAVIGERTTIDVLEQIIDMARSCAYPGGLPRHESVKNIADSWPEYVLEPNHDLTVLTSDMRCSIFQA